MVKFLEKAADGQYGMVEINFLLMKTNIKRCN